MISRDEKPGGEAFMLWTLWNSWAGAAVAILMGLAAVGIAAALLLLRDHLRLEKHTLALEAEVEGLQDRVWQISESEELYRGLVEAQLDVIVQRDGSGRITFANDGYAQLVGRPRQTLIGARTCPKVTEMGRVRPRPDGAKLVDEAIETPDGVRWFAWIETPVHARSGAIEILRAGREITERVVTERALAEERTRAEAASEAKSRFLATVSHEFRTPLNGILGMADLLLDTPLDLEQNTYIRAIKTSGGALLSLIDEILDFSKIEAGKIDIANEPFDLQSLVEGVVELLAPRAQGKGIEIASHIGVGVPSRVVGDADRLRQILVNLAGNAVKFTDQGGVGIEVSTAGREVTISVSDTGPGIAVDRIPQLFEEFEQGDGSPARKHGGTGLGLAISRRIVERMDGEITVESAPGAGARFTITLPLPAAERSTNQMFKGKHDISGKRYLVLARSPYEGPYILRKLVEAGAVAMQTDSETDALARIATAADSGQPFDGLIVDCALGDDIARDTAAAAKEAGVERRIVLLSPFERRDLGSPSAAGFDAYLVKPLRARSLFERLTEKRPPAPDFVTTRTTAPRVKPVPGGKARRVLLAEDNEINALLALKALERLGAVVDWAKDGHEAFSLAEASFSGLRPDYDLVLMDIRMPGLDGLEATRRIRALEHTLGRPQPRRIIALTANALKEDETAAVEAGLDGFLAKPFDIKDLTDLLEEGARRMVAASCG
jgi:signal transduction histidine kinase/CheY-like chemotaxis protein